MTTAPLAPLRPHPRAAIGALRIAYSDLATIAATLSEEDSWRATHWPGWAVRDLLLHLLGDAQRGLVALSTPGSGPADRDAVSWWQDTPRWPDLEYRNLRAQRVIASAWGLDGLARTFGETARAVVALAAHTAADALVATQDRVMRADDLVVTLAVEAAVHHLDLVAELGRPGPRPEPLALVRRTIDRLRGVPAPSEWPDERWTLLATGRVAPGGAERRTLGMDVQRLPLLGCG